MPGRPHRILLRHACKYGLVGTFVYNILETQFHEYFQRHPRIGAGSAVEMDPGIGIPDVVGNPMGYFTMGKVDSTHHVTLPIFLGRTNVNPDLLSMLVFRRRRQPREKRRGTA